MSALAARREASWLTDAAFAYTDNSVREPLAPPTATPAIGEAPVDTPADALAEVLTAIARRQHEHRERTAEPTELATYCRAKVHKDPGRTVDALTGMRHVAADDGRLAPRARRGLANLARIRGDFPTALAVVPSLGREDRHHRVLAHIHFPHGDIDRAAAFETARAEAEEHGAPGEWAIAQTLLALVTAFTDPVRADEELVLAHQLIDQLDQRATVLYAQVAALVRDAGTDRDVTNRATIVCTEATTVGLPGSSRCWRSPSPSTTPYATPTTT